MTYGQVKDNIFPNFHVCPRLNRATKEVKAGKVFKEHLRKVHDPLHQRLARLLGANTEKEQKKIKNTHILDCLQTHVCHGQPVPKAISSPSLLRELQQEVQPLAPYSKPRVH